MRLSRNLLGFLECGLFSYIVEIVPRTISLPAMGISVSNSRPSLGNYMILADGENLVFRYQNLLKTKKLNPTVVHFPDTFVWHQNVAAMDPWSLVRVNFYTSAVGDENKIAQLERQISKILVGRRGQSATQICPKVFKKENSSRKTRLVDISLAIDALRHSYHSHVEAILLMSGDGDYLPLVKEMMRNGTQVWLAAFSDGLNPALPAAVDKFIDLDSMFFLR